MKLKEKHSVQYLYFCFRQEGARSEAKLLSFAQYQDEIESAPKGALYGAGLTFNPNEFKAIRQVKFLKPPSKSYPPTAPYIL